MKYNAYAFNEQTSKDDSFSLGCHSAKLKDYTDTTISHHDFVLFPEDTV